MCCHLARTGKNCVLEINAFLGFRHALKLVLETLGQTRSLAFQKSANDGLEQVFPSFEARRNESKAFFPSPEIIHPFKKIKCRFNCDV